MEPITKFLILKNKNKEKPTHPDYTIRAKVGEQWEQVGGCWLKEDKNKEKYFSCEIKPKPKEIKKEEIPYPTEPNPEEIPF